MSESYHYKEVLLIQIIHSESYDSAHCIWGGLICWGKVLENTPAKPATNHKREWNKQSNF